MPVRDFGPQYPGHFALHGSEKKSIAIEGVEIFPRHKIALIMDLVTERDQPDPCLEQIHVWI
jgi:hypothetical protein